MPASLSKSNYNDQEAAAELSNLGEYDVSPGSTLNQYTSIIKLFIAFCEKHRPGLLYSKTDAETGFDGKCLSAPPSPALSQPNSRNTPVKAHATIDPPPRATTLLVRLIKPNSPHPIN